MYPLNKAGLLGSALIALLIITSCSDSGTRTGVAPLSRDAAETGAINNAALKKKDNGEHSDTDPGHSHSPDQQHGEAGNVSPPRPSSPLPLSRHPAAATSSRRQGKSVTMGLPAVPPVP